jgi:hypothetical protein
MVPENTEVMEYYELAGFEEFYLEDSYVLDLSIGLAETRIRLEVVLRENHPDYAPPREGEQYCYRQAEIRFLGYTQVTLSNIQDISTTDLDGETDFGNIDIFRRSGEEYFLSGDWGDLSIRDGEVGISLVEDSR